MWIIVNVNGCYAMQKSLINEENIIVHYVQFN